MICASQFNPKELITFLVIMLIVMPFVIVYGLRKKRFQDDVKKYLNVKNRKYPYATIRDKGKKYKAVLYDYKLVEELQKYSSKNLVYLIRVKYVDNDGVEHIVPEEDGYLYNVICQEDLDWLKKQKEFDISVYEEKYVSISLPSFNLKTNKFETISDNSEQ